ncbi:MAG: cytochrome c [Planctomycetes bacterium]|nr:cytochrome c [Planctomycetota bacterium]
MSRHPLRLALLGLFLPACGGPDQPAAAPPRSGAEVYAAVCAMCHGLSGDGQGTVKLDRAARDFRAGGFSFGNTREALFRTVSSGIGGTPMPGFGEVLSEEERRRVVEHLVGFLPEPPVEAGEAAVLTVGDRPQVVRGHLPALAEGLPEHPRGLLVGGTDGLSWEYRADDVRLLAVRQGAFVRRTDWDGRGGTPLAPLGKPTYLLDGGAPAATFATDAGVPLAARLRGTSIEDGRAWVGYSLHDAAGAQLAEVRETGAPASTSLAAGFRRTFEIDSRIDLRLLMLGADSDLLLGQQDGGAMSYWIHGGQPEHPVVVGAVADRGLHVLLQQPDATQVQLVAGRTRVELTTLLPSSWDAETRHALLAELEQ